MSSPARQDLTSRELSRRQIMARTAAALRAEADMLDLMASEPPEAAAAPRRERALAFREVAERLHVDESFARELARRGDLKVIRLGTRCVRVLESSLEALMGSRLVSIKSRRRQVEGDGR